MPAMQLIRALHAALAVLALLAYLTGEFGAVHAWLGYGLAAVVLLRLLAAFTGRIAGIFTLGLQRYYPHFTGLRFDNALSHPAVSRVLIAGIALSLIGATATGIAMDRGRTLALAGDAIVAPAMADEGRRDRPKRSLAEKALKEAHEVLANLMLLTVGAHVGYLLLFRRPLARFMLFLPPAAARGATPPGSPAPRPGTPPAGRAAPSGPPARTTPPGRS
jgi:cytochrome b